MQPDLFNHADSLPEGFLYRKNFLGPAEEAALLRQIEALPLHEASYKQWTAKRRIVAYGGSYDFSRSKLLDAQPMAAFLQPLRDRVAEWAGMPASEFEHAMIAEYRPGTQLGWHRDVPDFEVVVGVSLAGEARMRFRPYPPSAEIARATKVLDLEPRSAYVLRGPARWQWQHAISPTKSLRYSITFRSLAKERWHGSSN